MKKFFRVLTVIVAAMALLSTSAAATYFSYDSSYTTEVKTALATALADTTVYGDYDGDNDLDLADARSTLLYILGVSSDSLSSTQKTALDLDLDGDVDILDAREILRCANGISTTNTDILYLAICNAAINSALPIGYTAYYYTRDLIDGVSYDNQNLIDEFNSQIEDLVDALEDYMSSDELADFSDFDFGAELAAMSEITYQVSRYSSVRQINTTAYDSMFPLVDEENGYSSTLELDDIAYITYEANKTIENIYTYTTSNTVKGEYTVTGDVYTIYFNDETIYNYSEDTESTHGNAFYMPLASDVTFDLGETADLSGITSEMSIESTLDLVNFSGSSITIVLNNDESSSNYGRPIYIYYDLNYVCQLYTYMDINLNLSESLAESLGTTLSNLMTWIMGIDGDLLDISDHITLSVSESREQMFLFYSNGYSDGLVTTVS